MKMSEKGTITYTDSRLIDLISLVWDYAALSTHFFKINLFLPSTI
jgi:hypothetical protein